MSEINGVKIKCGNEILPFSEFKAKYPVLYISSMIIRDWDLDIGGYANMVIRINNPNYPGLSRMNNNITLSTYRISTDRIVEIDERYTKPFSEQSFIITKNSDNFVKLNKTYEFVFQGVINKRTPGFNFFYNFASGSGWEFLHKDYKHKEEIIKSFKEYLKNDGIIDNFYAIEKHHCKNSLSLEFLGFEKIHSFTNPNTKNLLNYYKYNFDYGIV